MDLNKETAVETNWYSRIDCFSEDGLDQDSQDSIDTVDIDLAKKKQFLQQIIALGTRILDDAPVDFIEAAYEIETTSSVTTQQQLAMTFIESHPDSSTAFNYKQLKGEISRIKDWQPKTCRDAYMLQYSIPLTAALREANHRPYNWIQRLLIFVNTYTVEHAVVKNVWNNLQFNFRTKIKGKHVIDHGQLKYGPGDDEADYYLWDTTKNKFYAFADLKCNFTGDSVENIINKYKNPRTRHNARFVLAYMHKEQKYYMIDYEDKKYAHAPSLPLPTGLFDIYSYAEVA